MEGAAAFLASHTPEQPRRFRRIANQVATAQGYDGVLRPTVRVHYFTPGTSNAVWSYGFNAASQLSAVARDNDAFAWTNHYAIERPYTTNGLNQYSAAGGAAFVYDDNGNLTSDPKRAFVYDIENRLVSATPMPGSDAVAAALVYDPLGRLFEVSSPVTGTRRFLYDGDALVAEYDGANAMIRRHVHNVGADVPMVTYVGADLSAPRQLLADHQGSIIALADASGAAIQINRYDEYGIPGAGNGGTFQYTGQMWLPELGMYHYKARIYSPTLGRFLQTDPVGYEGGINLYGYVGNDPVNATDPDGKEPLSLATLFDPQDMQMSGRYLEIPGTVTVVSHGRPEGVSFRSGRGPRDFRRVEPAALAAQINGRSSTQPVVLLGCRLGGAYARAMARRLGRPVVATESFVWGRARPGDGGWMRAVANRRDDGGQQDSSGLGRFEVYGGTWADIGINVPDGMYVHGFEYNSQSHRFRVIMVGEPTSDSRIRTTRVEERDAAR